MDIERTFTYHKPIDTQPERYEKLRFEAKVLAALIMKCCPDSRERSVALTNLQQTIMWANASIAINENPVE